MPHAGEIKAAREILGETQAQFGLRFGVDQSTVHRWETDGLPDRGAAKTAVERFLNELPSQVSAGETVGVGAGAS